MDDAKSFVRMDLDVNQIKKLLGEAGKDASKYRVTSIVPSLDDFLKNGVADNGQYILTPINGTDSWGDMRLWIHNTVEGITPTPTPAPTSATASATMKKPTSTP
jgi:hypothetical protein